MSIFPCQYIYSGSIYTLSKYCQSSYNRKKKKKHMIFSNPHIIPIYNLCPTGKKNGAIRCPGARARVGTVTISVTSSNSCGSLTQHFWHIWSIGRNIISIYYMYNYIFIYTCADILSYILCDILHSQLRSGSAH